MKTRYLASFSTVIVLILFSGFITFKNATEFFTSDNSHSSKSNLTNWEIDKDHSNIRFTINHLGIAKVDGFFRTFSGSMQSSLEDFSDAKISILIDVNSVDTNNEARDTHLKSHDFFYVAAFKEMSFESKSFKPGKGNSYKLSGKLTIRDQSKNVNFDVTHLGTITVTGIKKTAFEASATINRFDYNLTWNTTTPDGFSIIGEDVTITLNLEFTQGI